MTNFTKAERTYQNSKPYDFRDLELSLDFKLKECAILEKQVKLLQEENAALRYDVKKYEKLFEGSKGLAEQLKDYPSKNGSLQELKIEGYKKGSE